MKKFVIFLIVIITVSMGVYILKDNIKNLFVSAKKTVNLQKNAEPTTPAPKEVVITLTDKGFVPQSVRVQTGGIIFWVNQSGAAASVNSNDHPTNKLHSELNLGKFDDGSTLQLKFTKPGKYGYHNYIRPEWKGEVVVE